MRSPSIELSEKQVVSALSQFSQKELKRVIDNLFKKQLYTPPTLKEITREASGIVKKEGIKSETVKEAIKWARSQK